MACGCQGAKWSPPTAADRAAQSAARQAALAGAGDGRIGPQATGYTWNGVATPEPAPAPAPAPAPKTKAAKAT